MAISNTAITTSGNDIFTCPGTPSTDEREYAVTCIMFCNISGSNALLDVNVIPAGSAKSTLNQVISQLLIPAGETFTFDTEKLVLATLDRVHATANINNALVTTVSSMRVS